MTHTYALLEVPSSVYAAVRALLAQAQYQHAFIDTRTDGEVIDMHGIALKSRGGGESGAEVSVTTLLSSKTKEGRVELQLNGEITQMDLAKAHTVTLMLMQAIEAAGTDQMLYQFLTERIGLSEDKASMALMDFRELRQGTRERLTRS